MRSLVSLLKLKKSKPPGTIDCLKWVCGTHPMCKWCPDNLKGAVNVN